MSNNSQDLEWRALYFHPGQIMFHLTGTATAESTNALLEEAKKLAEESKGLQISAPRIQNFQTSEKYNDQQSRTESGGKNRSPFSLLYADVTKNGKRLGDKQDEINELLSLIFLLDGRLVKSSNESLQVVSPNWLTSGSIESPGGTGGPGGRPSPYKGESDNTEYKFHFSKSFLQQYSKYLETECDGDVVVAILDTVPYPKSWRDNNNSASELSEEGEWDYIYDEWVTQRKEDPHSLIRTLLEPGNERLTIHPDPRVLDERIEKLKFIDHDYEMHDHGLFVAGIINSLAPHAELHLFQVLNRYGVGNLEIIGETLAKVFSQFEDNHLVVNLSLNYSIPLEKAHTKQDKTHTKLGWPLLADISGGELLKPEHAAWLNRATKPAELMCDMFYDRKSGIIAAAGNDWDDQEPGSPRPKARYPAAFDHVVGVGALTRGSKGMLGKAANYSNLADRPPKNGITTLGGEEGTGNGILGTYIGKFPDGSPNNNGWAWWSGTSFATPIISGLVAAVFSCLLSENPQATTQDAIKVVFDAQKKVTKPGEDVFLVTQGTSQ